MQSPDWQQWFCDTCNETIETPGDGAVEWAVTEEQPRTRYGFRICHARTCFIYQDITNGFLPLVDMLGAPGVARMMSYLDHGRFRDPDFKHPPRVKNLREWVELFQRLQTPNYEEARRYFRQAKQDGMFAEHPEFYHALPDSLRALIKKYGQQT